MGILMPFIASSFTEIIGIWACLKGQFGKILAFLICLKIRSKQTLFF